jgi:hypothetical protein
VKVEYSGSKILEITKVDDDKEEQRQLSLSPPLFSLLYFGLYTFSEILAPDDGLIKVRYKDYAEKERQENVLIQNSEEKFILQDFSNYVLAKDFH